MKYLSVIIILLIGFYACTDSLAPGTTQSLRQKMLNEVWPEKELDFALIDTTQDLSGAKAYKILFEEKVIGYGYENRVKSCRTGGCPVLEEQTSSVESESYEFFDYIMFTDDKFSLMKLRVTDYNATHGDEICSKFWLRQFQGYSGVDTLVYGKEISAISGATISGNAMTVEVQNAISELKRLTGTN